MSAYVSSQQTTLWLSVKYHKIMEATRKRKQSYCVHTTEDGTRCQKTIQHWSFKLCRRHYNDRGGEIIRTPQRRNTHTRNDAPTSVNRVHQSHNLQEEEEEEEEEDEGAIAHPSATGAIARRRDLMTTTTMMMTNNDSGIVTNTPLSFLFLKSTMSDKREQIKNVNNI